MRHKATVQGITAERKKLQVITADAKQRALEAYNAEVKRLDAAYKRDLDKLCREYASAKAYLDKNVKK